METQYEIELTRRWIASMVIGLNLCPFAERVFTAERIRYAVTKASETSELLLSLTAELELLTKSPIKLIETSFLIHPNALTEFLDYNDFLGNAEALVQALGLRGEIQIVGFHPNYQFEGAGPEAAENYTNRSPYPMLHLLREQSVSAVAVSNDLSQIPVRNIETLNRLGREEILKKLKALSEAPNA